MLNYNSVIKNEMKQESISVKEISPVIKINLRGKKREFLTNVGKNLNMILPTEANTSTTSDKLTAIWLSPDEWMIISNELSSKDTNKSDLYEMLFDSISKTNLQYFHLYGAESHLHDLKLSELLILFFL